MKQKLTRNLVLHNEGAKHPFRLSLPLEVFAVAQDESATLEAEAPTKKWLNEDTSLFLLSFSAFFTAFYLFIF
ncbi:MAG: hypothetical protein ABJP02_05320 [Parasphingorhabdus sp.]|uniref:hypothetical protein n=1 Tax=Parasphingorhabdus sp. TaxID=2709688 RepID=UPI003299C75E